jgi:type I restriction enzyme R subunit
MPIPGSLPLASTIATEKALVEAPAIELLSALGWHTANLFDEAPGPANPTGRRSFRDVFLPTRLRAAVRTLNPLLPEQALDDALAELTSDRSAMLPTAANREVFHLLRDGVPVELRQPDGSSKPDRVRLIDWKDASQNDFFVATQVWITSELYRRRPDAIGFVNGIPLLLMEFKAPQETIAEAYEANLRDYRDTIPHLFHPNGFVILSNAHQALMGASHAAFEYFAPWKRLEEDAPAAVDLETMLRAACDPTRFLDVLENFIAFEEARGGLVKKIAKYHQVLGVNRAIQAVQRIQENQGRLGVFWHTQGSGKSLSMMFFAEKVLRTMSGNWTFVIVTDRNELDDQIAATFAATGALTKDIKDCQAQTRVHLRELLAGNERYVFTLIHKFSTDRGEVFPELSARKDVIVITDEAHRSQYDQLAANMRRALPYAAFIGFTGTPLIAGQEERTREVFGDYVSVYNFAQSVEDGATVPLFYEARKPELQLAKDDLRDELDTLLDEAALDEEQEKRLQQQFARQYHLITREDRLEKVAADLVRHFAARGYRGKAMFVAIDKATAVRMYEKVRKHWAELLAEGEADLLKAPEQARNAVEEHLAWMRATDMAVVVSQGQNEIADLKLKGLDILPHRKRMQEEDLDAKFKDPHDPFRLVFVCAMWITGFDVPTCSTMYIDKPMKNHTLMQAIARANRRAPEKEAGVIVDYVGVFANLERALAIYAAPRAGEHPIQDKEALVVALQEALAEANTFCAQVNADVEGILAVEKFQRVQKIADAMEKLIAPDERRRGFLRHAGAVARAYKALLPDDRAAPFLKPVASFLVVADTIRNHAGEADISAISAQIEALLDANIEGVAITAPIRESRDTDGLVDLSSIDFDQLAKLFAQRPNTAAQALRAKAERKVREMVAQNPTRLHLAEKLEKLVDSYNAGTLDVTAMFEELKKLLTGEMDEEQRRAAREELTEEELAIFDLLTKPEPKLTEAQEVQVKKVARDLLRKLKEHELVFNWDKRQETRAGVLVAIRVELNELPEEPYPEDVWNQKVDATWQFVFSRYSGAETASAFLH